MNTVQVPSSTWDAVRKALRWALGHATLEPGEWASKDNNEKHYAACEALAAADAWMEAHGEWKHCSPALLASGVSCADTPRRACECEHGGSHDHWIVNPQQRQTPELDALEQQASEIDALRQQLEQAQKDAERYRWLRDSDDMYVGPEYTTYNDSIVDGEYKNFTYMKPEEFDAAIDAAMESDK